MNKIVIVVLLGMSVANMALADTTVDPLTTQVQADANQVNLACAQDAKTAGCPGEVVGKGLLSCLENYEKTHRPFKVSTACKVADSQFRKDRMQADVNQANLACAQDANTAECSGKAFDKGLGVCLQNYEKTHKPFKVAPNCQAAWDIVSKDNEHAAENAKANKVDQACEQEEKATGCSVAANGKELITCLIGNPFSQTPNKVSVTCREAAVKFRQEQ